MKVIILAGGLPSTISNEQTGIPKPMVEIGENPILWHIMKNFAQHGLTEFIICAGYRVDAIKDYFNDFYIYQSDITVDLSTNTIQIHKNVTEDWKVTIVDTGLYSATGQRVNKIQSYIDEEEFIVTYGDCLADINVEEVIAFHREHKKLATMIVARPTGRNTMMAIDKDGNYLGSQYNSADETDAWTNTGTYVFNREIFKYILGNYELEKQLLEMLVGRQQVMTYKHHGFWAPIETRRDKEKMENLWNAQIAPWKNW